MDSNDFGSDYQPKVVCGGNKLANLEIILTESAVLFTFLDVNFTYFQFFTEFMNYAYN